MNIAFKDFIPYKIMKERRINQFYGIMKSQKEPEIYDDKGNRKRVFFIVDTVSQTNPDRLMVGHCPQEIYWDRFNVGLPIQFFGHEYISMKASPYCEKKFGILVESEEIRKKDFERVVQDKGILNDCNRVYTHSERVLDSFSNAAFIPACGLWYGTEQYGGKLSENAWEKKKKNISVVSSNKGGLKYYEVRKWIANRAVKTGLVDGYGNFCNKWIDKKADALTDYRYSIVVENDIKPLYFTEKILDCFASMTIPIYLGASKIGNYFNMDGIILLNENELDSIEKVLLLCNEKEYLQRKDAIIDNYYRVQKYRCIEDYIMREYRTDFI